MLLSPFFAWLKQPSPQSKGRRRARVVRESRQRKLYLEVLEDRTLLSATVTSVLPDAGPAGGTNTVTINGTGFAGNGTDTVMFGSNAATLVTDSSTTSITVIAPSGTGTVDVSVDGSAANPPADEYTYTAAATVTALSVSAGPTGGGNSVTITGTNFAGTGDTVLFGTTAATVTADSATSITVTAPPGSAGTVDVTVDGSTANPPADDYTYVAAPTVTGLTPTAGPLAGGTSVTITGTGFTGATAVDFGTVAATSFTVNSDTSITAIDPAEAAGTVHVTVANAGGTSSTSAANQFTYTAAPTVTGLAPNTGPAAGGTQVTITGTGFTGATAVNFGSTVFTPASFTVNSDTSITFTVPAGTAGAQVNVTVTTAGGTSAVSSADLFTYATPPPAPTPSQPPSLNVPPLLGLINAFFHGAETVNANGTVTVTYSVFGFTFLSASYNSSGDFVSGALFGFTLPNFIWSL
ncbi:MAG TPA: IPT/TIG domain-containing protein [Gemmataceae bacterium]|nr:IPT/TIG domain-containing protein [Gemmataceae bacterium]